MHSRRRRTRRAAPAAIVAFLAASACGPAPNGDEWDVLMPEAELAGTTRISASVAYMDLEGGLYVLRTADGTNYDPTNLPEAYQVDGQPVEADVVVRDDMASIGMVGPIVDIVRIRSSDGGSATGGESASGGEPALSATIEGAEHPLWNTAWRLEDLAGRGVIDAATATLEFPEPGRIAGNGSCNRFRGPIEVAGDSITNLTLAITRMACTEAVNDQEARYVDALEHAVSYRIDDPFLYIHASNLDEPLRLIRRAEGG